MAERMESDRRTLKSAAWLCKCSGDNKDVLVYYVIVIIIIIITIIIIIINSSGITILGEL